MKRSHRAAAKHVAEAMLTTTDIHKAAELFATALRFISLAEIDTDRVSRLLEVRRG